MPGTMGVLVLNNHEQYHYFDHLLMLGMILWLECFKHAVLSAWVSIGSLIHCYLLSFFLVHICVTSLGTYLQDSELFVPFPCNL